MQLLPARPGLPPACITPPCAHQQRSTHRVHARLGTSRFFEARPGLHRAVAAQAALRWPCVVLCYAASPVMQRSDTNSSALAAIFRCGWHQSPSGRTRLRRMELDPAPGSSWWRGCLRGGVGRERMAPEMHVFQSSSSHGTRPTPPCQLAACCRKGAGAGAGAQRGAWHWMHAAQHVATPAICSSPRSCPTCDTTNTPSSLFLRGCVDTGVAHDLTRRVDT